MTEKEKELKSFNQCADALNSLDKRSILKVFHMLSIHFEVVENIGSQQISNNFKNDKIDKFEDIDEVEPQLIEPKKTSTRSRTTNSGSKKIKTQNSKNPVYLTDFDFKPYGKKSLKEYYNEFISKSNYDNNLIFLHYLQEILNESDITTNHIYSCYRELNLKIPSLPQTLIDTKKNKGWIETANMNDLKLTRTGINWIQHDLAKKDV